MLNCSTTMVYMDHIVFYAMNYWLQILIFYVIIILLI